MTGTATPPVATDLAYSVGKPALLFGADSDALRRTSDLLDAAGVRLAGRGALGDAVDRLDAQIAVGLVWIECDDAGGGCPPTPCSIGSRGWPTPVRRR